jgi:Dyp-type peroxidase family
MTTNVQAREVPTPISTEATEQVPGKAKGKKAEREPALEVGQIQGNILAGFNKDNQTLIFVDIKDQKKFKTWLGAIVPFIASTEEVLQFNRLFKMVRARRKVESRAVLSTWLNVAFSFRGLKKLVKKEADEFKDEAFRAGLAARSHLLSDPPAGEGSPANWLIGGKNNEADLVFIIGSDSLDEMGYAVRRLESWIYEGAELGDVLVPSGAAVIFKQKGAVLPSPLTGHEQFGFLDGVSQPGVRGTVGNTEEFFTPRQNPADPTQGKPGQDCLWPGEFVFGYRGQSPTDSDGAGKVKMDGPEWAKNGSYLVFRRLRQDVGGFHDFLKQEGDRLNLGPELFGAKCVGRWASGAPIERAPLADNEKMSRDDCANNAFEFHDGTIPGVPKPDSGECRDNFPNDLAKKDPLGTVCPFAGHIRKAYPRDDVSSNPKIKFPNDADTELHRMLRRGIPFGDPFDPTVIPDDGNRGLLFVAYQTSIVDQFEFVTRNWVNNPNFKDPGAGHDPILGQTNQNGSRQRFFKLKLPNGQPQTVRLPKDFVIPTGGGYFFAPSIKALKEHLST